MGYRGDFFWWYAKEKNWGQFLPPPPSLLRVKRMNVTGRGSNGQAFQPAVNDPNIGGNIKVTKPIEAVDTNVRVFD